MRAFFLSPFRANGRWQWALVALYLFINLLVAYDAIRTSAYGGYDAGDHQKNIAVLAALRLPGPQDSREFYSPPLPYLLPAALIAFLHVDPYRASKYAQGLNILLSIVTTLFLLHLCELLRPADARLKFTALLLLGVLPVYYRTFSFVRGEPFVACFAVVVAWLTLRVFTRLDRRPGIVVALGISMGLLVLSRQWGFLLIPAIILLAGIAIYYYRATRRALAVALVASLVIALIVAGWYYALMRLYYGNAAAYDRAGAPQFSLANQPPQFYFGTGNGVLFTDPVDRSFPNQFMPIFYSELWGDYWGFFAVYGSYGGNRVLGPQLVDLLKAPSQPPGFVTNRYTINSYLGAMNVAGLLPSSLSVASVLAALVYSLRDIRRGDFTVETAVHFFLAAIIGASFAGYLWFLIQFPTPIGDTIKATEMLHTYPFVAILTALFVQRLTTRWRFLYPAVVAYLCLLFVVALPVMLTQNY